MVILTIGGPPGSGTTTACKLLEQRLRIPYVYAGGIFRDMAEERGMCLAEFGAYCERNPDIDKELDARQLEILKHGGVVLEGRLSGWIASRNGIAAFKVWMDADLDVRAKRIVNREGGDVNSRMAEMLAREASERKRYSEYYGIDLADISMYDLVVDTGDKTPDEIVDLVIKSLGL
ncbi:MAG: cytidylate kinase [Thermoplasmata archaeon HGW-Thermoplasmata-1]|nr:MAG: cytidylate kinase [Thermoplasmata archaeon HGW-Thermoplasmata-1]